MYEYICGIYVYFVDTLRLTHDSAQDSLLADLGGNLNAMYAVQGTKFELGPCKLPIHFIVLSL